jgi:hypothetical protein
MISRVFDLQRQVFIVVSKTCTFGIAIGVDIETDCDSDTDPDNTVCAASSGSHIKPAQIFNKSLVEYLSCEKCGLSLRLCWRSYDGLLEQTCRKFKEVEI